MINDQLLDYIKHQLSLNVPKETLATNLKGAGWNEADVAEAFKIITPAPIPAPIPVSPIATTVTPSIGVLHTDFPKMVQMVTEQPVHNVQPVHKSKKIFSIILILVLLVLAGGGAYAYYTGVFVSLPSLAREAIDKARATTSGSYDTTVTIDLSEVKDATSGLSQLLYQNISAQQISVTTKGLYDVSDPNNLKSSSVFSVAFGALSLEAEFRILDKTLYGALMKAPTVMLFGDLSLYINKWFSFPYKSADGQMANNPLTTISPINPNLASKLTQEQKDYIYKLSRDAHFIKTVERLAPENIGGESSYHFIFDLDREGIVSYLQSLKEYVNNVGKDDSALSAFDPTSFAKTLDEIKDFKGEIWIGRNDKLLHKITFNFGVQPDKTKDEQIKISVVGIMSGWNQPVTIVAPAESTPFETFFSNIIAGSALGAAREKGKEASIKAQLSTMRAQAELFYNDVSSYSGFCLSKELKVARTSIEDNGGTEFVCKDAPEKYVVSAKISQNFGYWCVDSTGASKATTTTSTNTVCPVK